MTMIEKLARAIGEAYGADWDRELDEGDRNACHNYARAVLTALLEPDEGMVRAGANGYDEARCRINSAAHGSKCAPMSDQNKLTIAPMIGCAITAAIDHILLEADRD